MPRKKPTLFCLKRGELRQSWNKYNLYNLSRWRPGINSSANYFKAKWSAKSKTRKYHGEQVLEKKWQRLFSPTMRAVVPMNPNYLAKSDGSLESAGRGSGLDSHRQDIPATPYQNMTFAPLERRLDVAIHRALFASSVRQARQFCVHGFVKVNGKKMVHPSYALNPGDMFQVDPDRVLFATGASKDVVERRESRRLRTKSTTEEKDVEPPATELDTEPMPEEEAKATLQALMQKTKDLLTAEKTSASAKRKRDMRELQKMVRSAISRDATGKAAMKQDATAQMDALMQRLNIQVESEPEAGSEQVVAQEAEGQDQLQSLTPRQKKDLEHMLAEIHQNPIDPSKPYATPWRPRDFMSAFAFIPRYLEVHHKVCSAVYLRHPVVRPGLAEVPTPFTQDFNTLAFNWYLRRR